MHGLPPDALVEQHLWIVDKFASTYRASAPQADLRAAGALGLCEAARRFKPRKGAAFSTYAWNWVKGYVLSELRRAHVVPVPEHLARAASRRGEPVRGVVVFAHPRAFDGVDGSTTDAEQERAAERAMRHRTLHHAVEALDTEHRHVVNRTLAGRSIEQIAKGMRCTQTRVTELLEEAQTQLAEILAHD